MKSESLLTKMMRVALAILLWVVGIGAICAQNFTVGNLNYSVNSDGTTVTVTGHVDGTAASGTLDIPASISHDGTTFLVTIIGDEAFYNCRNLTGSLVIPNSVTIIGDYTFYGCIGFTGSITIPDSMVLIGAAAFANCENVTSIHFNASHCESMGKVEGEDYWYYVFYNNTSLNEIVIGDNVTFIPTYAFANHNSRNCQVVLGNSVEIIDYGAFYNNGNENYPGLVGSLILPNSVIEIGMNAFFGCRGLTGSLTIGNSVTTIGRQAFYECSGFTGDLTIGNSVTTIDHLAFLGCSGFTGRLIIPNSVTTIGNYAFYFCSGFTGNLNIPNSVATIGQSAFYGCSGFSGNVTIGNSVNLICEWAFYDCSGLSSVIVLSGAPPIILDDVFYNVPCTTLIVRCDYASIYETSDWANYFSTIEEDCDSHNVIIDESIMNGGNVSASVTSTELGEEVQLTITPDEGMMLASLIVSNANDPSQIVPVYPIGKTTSMWGFIMPPFDVVITATFDPTTTIGEKIEALVSVYPNPTNSKVIIESEDLKHITISNMLGQVVYEGNASGDMFEYDFGKHGAGLYLIRIETTDGVALKKVSVAR